MSVRKKTIRFAALAAMAGAGLAVVHHIGPDIGQGRAQVAPVVLTAGSPPALAQPDHVQAAAAPHLPSTAISAPEIPTRRQIHAQTLVAPSAAPETSTAVATSPLGLPCGLSLTAEAMPGAMVALDIFDPCAPQMRLTVTHGALGFTAQTDAMGLLTLDVPALETPAFFTVTLADGRDETVMAGVPDLADHARAAIAWDEDRGLQLHALEDGAAYGETGHIWQDAPGTIADTIGGTGGFLTRLGDATVDTPRLAQVYTAPRDMRDGVALSVEVPVTAENCGRPVRAQSLQITPDGPVSTRPVTLIIPGCDAAGEYLLLQNLFVDLRLAAN